jgi:SAM-dependent methyltransferase
MTDDDLAAFFTVHRGLPREGPGTSEDVLWALAVAGTPEAARICDAGCGPGADLVTLAGTRPAARIEGIEAHAGFVAEAAGRVAPFGPRVAVRQGDMAAPGGPFDLIWCAGALYFLGVEAGLAGWRASLAPGGRVAFSHPVVAPDDPPEVAAFWQGEAGVGTQGQTEAAIARAGYAVLGWRRIAGAAWEAYYTPLAARVADLRAGPVSPVLDRALAATEREIALWRAVPDRIAYGLWVVAPA